jgi:phosphoserine phosphatase
MTPSLALHGVQVGKAAWLEPNLAADLFVTHDSLSALDAHVQSIVQDHPYDAVVQWVKDRRKKLLISDMDSTMITVECIDELADFVGKKKEVAIITDRAMNGELNFEAALTERVALLKGLSEKMLQQCYDERVRMMPGAQVLVRTMRAHGARCVLVSGGFAFFTSRVREALGFHEDYANLLEVEHGMLTGRVKLPILGKEAKLKTLEESCAQHGIAIGDVLAVGDGANDLPMLMAAGLGVAYHAKPVVRAQAQARLTHCNLSALLFAQGYGKDSWKA